jgi:hypothetical protein
MSIDEKLFRHSEMVVLQADATLAKRAMMGAETPFRKNS